MAPAEVLSKLAVLVMLRERADARLQRSKSRVARRAATGAALLVRQLHLEADQVSEPRHLHHSKPTSLIDMQQFQHIHIRVMSSPGTDDKHARGVDKVN